MTTIKYYTAMEARQWTGYLGGADGFSKLVIDIDGSEINVRTGDPNDEDGQQFVTTGPYGRPRLQWLSDALPDSCFTEQRVRTGNVYFPTRASLAEFAVDRSVLQRLPLIGSDGDNPFIAQHLLPATTAGVDDNSMLEQIHARLLEILVTLNLPEADLQNFHALICDLEKHVYGEELSIERRESVRQHAITQGWIQQ